MGFYFVFQKQRHTFIFATVNYLSFVFSPIKCTYNSANIIGSQQYFAMSDILSVFQPAVISPMSNISLQQPAAYWDVSE